MTDDKDSTTGTTKPGPEGPAADVAPEAPKADTPWADVPEGEAGEAAQGADLAAENAQLRDQILRTLAEMENLRRRTEREVRDAGTYAIASFARDMLNVGDNMRRAMEAIPEDALSHGDAAFKALHDGVEMTERELLRALEKHGIKQLDPKDQRFDPNFHQAMFEVDNPDVPSGTVVQVVQAGYVIGDRVLRPALVGIAKGGARQSKPAMQAANDGGPQAREPAGEPSEAAGGDAGQQARSTRAAQGGVHTGPGERKGAKVDKSA